MTRQELINKVRKILSRASSANQHEAKLARELVSKLMQKHNIREEELKEREKIKHIINHNEEIKHWQQVLAKSITIIDGCEAKITTSHRGIILIGEDFSIKSAIKNYEWYSPRIAQNLKHRTEKEFAYGIVIGAMRKLMEKLKPKKAQSSSKSATTLTVIPKADSKSTQSTEENQPTLVAASQINNKNAFREGFIIGLKIELPPWVEPIDELDELFEELGWEDDLEWDDMI